MSFLAELIAKYPKVDVNALLTYKKEDEWIVLNENDPNLHPIWIKLPKPGEEWSVHTINHNFAKVIMPEYHEMVNFGLKAKDQYFQREKMPPKLQAVMKRFDNNSDLIWPHLKSNSAEFYDEIQWIKKVIRLGFTGQWQFVNGKPTYIDGWHFEYINFWEFADNTKPDYRDKDRKWYHGLRYVYTTTESPFVIDGEVQYEDVLKRRPKMLKHESRTMIGYLYPKGRRDGATNKHLCAQYIETRRRFGVHSGIIADTGDKSEEIFTTISVPGWRNQPFFFKPMTSAYDDPSSELAFKPQRSRKVIDQTQIDQNKSRALRSRITYSDKASGAFYDGLKMFWIDADEGGKTKEVEVDERHKVLLPCVAQGNRAVIGGLIGYPSTVGEMEKKGGMAFFRLSKMSHFEKRDRSGQTASGLMNFFFPSFEGLEGYIDEYGMTVIETPEVPIKGINGKMITLGSREALMSKRNILESTGDVEAYNEEVRLYPIWFKECFRTKDGDIGFNVKKIDDQIDAIRFHNEKLGIKGNFKWKDDVKDSIVIFEEDEENGRWFVTKLIAHNNKRYLDGDIWRPDERFSDEFTHSADPFKANKTQGKRMSLGGGSIFLNYNESIDGKKRIQDWITHTTVATYLFRPNTLPEFCEDQLMACLYYNCLSYPEIDVAATWTHFEERGYAGFMKYDIDPASKKLKNTPGFTSRGSQQKLFNTLRDYFEKHSHREKHLAFLMQAKDAQGLEDFTDLDLLVAGGGAIMGSNIVYESDQQKKEKDKTQKEGVVFFRKKRYS